MKELLTLLESEFGPGITADTPLVSSGIVDSLRFVRLVAKVGAHFAVTIDTSDVGVDNFDTPAQMLAFATSLARGA
jgi:acyl carrier protein